MTGFLEQSQTWIEKETQALQSRKLAVSLQDAPLRAAAHPSNVCEARDLLHLSGCGPNLTYDSSSDAFLPPLRLKRCETEREDAQLLAERLSPSTARAGVLSCE